MLAFFSCGFFEIAVWDGWGEVCLIEFGGSFCLGAGVLEREIEFVFALMFICKMPVVNKLRKRIGSDQRRGVKKIKKSVARKRLITIFRTPFVPEES